METRQATATETKRFEQWVDMATAINLRWNSMNNAKAQCEIAAGFASRNGFAAPSIESSVASLERQRRQQLVMEKIINDVRSERIGLVFPSGTSGDINIVSERLLNADEIAQYQFGGVLVIIGGGMIIAGIIMKATGLWDEDPEIEHNLETCKRFVEDKAAADPQLAAAWEQEKEASGWHEKQSWVDRLSNQAADLWNRAQEPLMTGLTYAVPIIAGVIGIALLMRRK